MIKDYIKYAFGTFKQRKMRTFLTMIGIFIGIAALVSLISLGQGLQKTIAEQFEMLGVDKIIIYPGTNIFAVGAGGSIELKEKDLNVVKKTKGINLVGGMTVKVAKTKFRGETKYTWVSGLPQDETKRIIESMQSFNIEHGRDLKKGDKYKAVIGIMLAEGDFFDKKVLVGDNIEIEGKEFKVVGIMARIGNPQDDSSIMIPLDTSREVLKIPDKYGAFIAQVKSNADVTKVAEDVKKRLRKSRNVEEGEEDFTVQTSEQLMETFQIVFTVVQAILIGIAAISLFVGGIGIMNTMFTSVLQRTQEIGIMKAIGARNSDIMQIFLIESGLLGMAGGAIGIIMGVGLSKLVELIAVQAGITMIEAYFPWHLIVGSLAFSFIVGTLSGILPARQASRLKPVDALRYE